MTCEQAAGLVSREADGGLPADGRVWFALHLLICGDCRRYRRQVRLVDAAARAVAESAVADDGLPAAARERITAALRAGPGDAG